MGSVVALHDRQDAFALYRLWWGDAGGRLTEKTARTYRYFVLRAFADTAWDPLTVGTMDIQRYLAEFRPQHANMIRNGLADFFAYTYRLGLRATNPVDETPRRRRARKLKVKRSLTADELVRLLVAVAYLPPRFPWSGRRSALLVLAQYLTATRPGELLNLDASFVKLDGPAPLVEITATKTGDDRLVPLSPHAVDVFRELVDDRPGRISHIGTTRYYEIVHRAAIVAEIPAEKARPYAIRHTAATHMLERGADIRTVADILGHTDLRHTITYTVSSTDQRRRAIELLG